MLLTATALLFSFSRSLFFLIHSIVLETQLIPCVTLIILHCQMVFQLKIHNFHFRSLYFTNRAYGYKITCDQNEILQIQSNQLSYNQEEVEAKVLLATQFAKNISSSDITVFINDSDIAILAAFYARKINCRLMVHIGVASNVRILDMGGSKWSDGVLECLPALRFCVRY